MSEDKKETIAEPVIDPAITEGKEWRPLLSLLNDAQIKDIRENAPLNQFTIDIDGKPKTFIRKKIKTKDYSELEQLRARFAKEKDSEQKSKLQMEVFQKAALYYLGMTAEEFDVCDFETVKKAVDAQNIRTIYGIPNSTTS